MTQKTYLLENRIERVDVLAQDIYADFAELLPDNKKFAFEVCLVEALANAVQHGSNADGSGEIPVRVESIGGNICVNIYDDGTVPWADILNDARDFSDIPDTNESGRGLALILSLADGATYQPDNQRNRLTMTFSKEISA